jgi:hypothetical protein
MISLRQAQQALSTVVGRNAGDLKVLKSQVEVQILLARLVNEVTEQPHID